MPSEPTPKKKPLGDSIRELVNGALEDERRAAVQAELLDTIFTSVAEKFPDILSSEFRQIFNQASFKHKNDRNPFIIEALTLIDRNTGEPGYSPTRRFTLPIVTAFTQFTAEDIKGMPGYIKLHEAARDANIAVRLVGLTAEESKGASGYSLPPILILDATKTYLEGALENGQLYPDLPPPKAEFDGDKPQSFNF